MHSDPNPVVHMAHGKAAVIGLIATGGGTFVSLLPKVEAWVRLSSVSVGLIIGLITLYRMFFGGGNGGKK